MASVPKLTPLGPSPYFPPLGDGYRSDEGFIVYDEFGGPDSLAMLKNFTPRPDDCYVVSFPKTGTTWLQEIVYLIGTDLNFEKAKSTHLMLRCPYLDWRQRPSNLDDVDSPRFLKFHLPYSMIPESVINMKCKIFYPMRNPKDTLVSYYHFCKSDKLIGYNGDFETFFNLFLEDKVLYAPYWKHCQEFWERRHEDNIFIVTFEDMKKDLPSVIRKVADFMGKKLTPSQVEAVAKHCGFEAMKSNPSTNPDLDPKLKLFLDQNVSLFMRKGQVGDWKNHFTEEMSQRMDEYVDKYYKDFNFVYEM